MLIAHVEVFALADLQMIHGTNRSPILILTTCHPVWAVASQIVGRMDFLMIFLIYRNHLNNHQLEDPPWVSLQLISLRCSLNHQIGIQDQVHPIQIA